VRVLERKFKILLPILFSFLVIPSTLAWWNDNWDYRIIVNVTENFGESFTNYPINYLLYHGGNASSNCSDVRAIVDSQEIPFGVRNCNSTHFEIVVQLNLTASSDTEHSIYYGNPSASHTNSSWDDVYWNFYDYFDDSIVDTNRWEKWSSNLPACNLTEQNGYIESKNLDNNQWCGATLLFPEFELRNVYIESNASLRSGGVSSNAQLQFGLRVNKNGEGDGGVFTVIRHEDYNKNRIEMYGTNMTGTWYYPYDPALDDWNVWKLWAVGNNRTYNVYNQFGILSAYNSSTTGNTYEEAPNYTFMVRNDLDHAMILDYYKIKQYAEPEPTLSFGSSEEVCIPDFNLTSNVTSCYNQTYLLITETWNDTNLCDPANTSYFVVYYTPLIYSLTQYSNLCYNSSNNQTTYVYNDTSSCGYSTINHTYPELTYEFSVLTLNCSNITTIQNNYFYEDTSGCGYEYNDVNYTNCPDEFYECKNGECTNYPFNREMSGIGSGVGSLLTGIGTPLAVFLILLSASTAVGIILYHISKGVGEKV
jgi:hypothetical protein